ncbi:hypothetical protein LZ31DRAFT_33712 [Colletotrichum somersetense]|nr:hypothetical protein LZ31DRAFT_33712 [Colletotrichum somersetense]
MSRPLLLGLRMRFILFLSRRPMPWQICTLPRCYCTYLSKKRNALVGRRRRLDCTSPWISVCHPCLLRDQIFSFPLSLTLTQTGRYCTTPHCLGSPPATIVGINACRLC